MTKDPVPPKYNTDFEVQSLDEAEIADSPNAAWSSYLKYIIAGIFFGIVLIKSEVVSWFRIQEMFRFQSFHMYGIIGSAVCVGMLSVFLIKKYKIKTLIVAGGVAANAHLRNEMKKITGKNVKLLFPTPLLSTDNSIMIGIAGYLNFMKNKKKVPNPESIKADGNLKL